MCVAMESNLWLTGTNQEQEASRPPPQLAFCPRSKEAAVAGTGSRRGRIRRGGGACDCDPPSHPLLSSPHPPRRPATLERKHPHLGETLSLISPSDWVQLRSEDSTTAAQIDGTLENGGSTPWSHPKERHGWKTEGHNLPLMEEGHTLDLDGKRATNYSQELAD